MAVVNREQRRLTGRKEGESFEHFKARMDAPRISGVGQMEKTEKPAAPTAEPEANEYVRELTDDELVQLAVHIGQRVAAFGAQGVALPMQQIENHHLIALLECFVGPEESLRVREFHLTWLDKKLDVIDAQLRMQMLSGVNGGPS